VDKYQTLAREATTAGDPVKAENYYQHAEHYFRVLSANAAIQEKQQRENRNDRNNNATATVAQNAENTVGSEAKSENGAAVDTSEQMPSGETEVRTKDAQKNEAIVERIEVVEQPVPDDSEESVVA
jgi:hypothetical protein